MKHKIERTKDCWIINNKYAVDDNGTVWNYCGGSMYYGGKDFPQYVFKLRDKLLKK